MRSLPLLLLTASIAVGQPTGGYYKVDKFSAADSVLVPAAKGSFLDGALGLLRINAAETDWEFVVPSGTGVPVNQHGAVLTGTTTADTLVVGTLLASDTSSFKPQMTSDTLNVTDRATFDYATASTDAVFDANKRLVSNAVTGTGNSVRANGATVSNLTANTLLKVNGSGLFGTDAGSLAGDSGVRVFYSSTMGAGRIFAYNYAEGSGRPLTLSGNALRLEYDGSATFASMVGTGTRLATATSEGVLGNATTIAGAYTWAGAQTLQSTLAVTGNLNVNSGNFTVNASTGDVGTRGRFRTPVGIDFATGRGSYVGDTESHIYRSTDGGSYPFNAFGNFIAEWRPGYDMLFVTGGTPRAIIKGNGNFLIGTTINGTGKLQVNGTAYATRFQSGTGTSAFDTITANVLDIGTITGGGLFDSMEVDGPLYLPDLTANRPLYLDGDNKIATGTWSGTGTVIPTTQGATLNNPTLTGTVTTPTAITMGSNTFTRSGAHALTLTTGATTNVTLPASGTLATLAGTETLSNKSLTAPTLTGTTTAGRIESSDTVAAVGLRAVRGNFQGNVGGANPSGVHANFNAVGASGNGSAVWARATHSGSSMAVTSAFRGTVKYGGSSSSTIAAAFHADTVDATGATNAYAFYSSGEAPSYFGGGVSVRGAMTTRGVNRSLLIATSSPVVVYPPHILDYNYIGSRTGSGYVELPLPSEVPVGREYTIFLTGTKTSGGSGTINVTTSPSSCFVWQSDPSTSITLEDGGLYSATFINDGTCWRIAAYSLDNP